MISIYPDKAPFFSVIICTYNRANIICRALDALLNQTCTDWEGLIVDDGSNDHTLELISPYLQKKFRYLYHSNRGCALSKNAGMLAASGKYITFLDSDDEYKPEHLEIRRNILENEPDIDLLHSDVEVIGNRFVPDRNDREKMVDVSECIIGGTFVIRREAMLSSDGFEDIFSEDAAFLHQFSASGKNKIRKIKSPTYIYHRDGTDSICHT